MWYRQNSLLIAEAGHPDFAGIVPSDKRLLDRVHPEMFERKMAKYAKMYRWTAEGMLKRLRGTAS